MLGSPHFYRNLLTNSTTGFCVYSLHYFTFLHFLWLIKTGLKTKVKKFEFIPLLFRYKVDVSFCEELHSIALFSSSNLQLFFTDVVLDFQFEVTKNTIHYFYRVSGVTKDSVRAVKAGELLSGQVKLKSDKTQVLQSGSVTRVSGIF